MDRTKRGVVTMRTRGSEDAKREKQNLWIEALHAARSDSEGKI